MARGELTPQDIEIREKISRNINRLIKERGVSQVDIHNHTKIPKSTLTGYVKGTSTPNPGNVQKLADFFNVKKSDIDPRFKPMPNNVVPILSSVKIPILGEIDLSCNSLKIFLAQSLAQKLLMFGYKIDDDKIIV